MDTHPIYDSLSETLRLLSVVKSQVLKGGHLEISIKTRFTGNTLGGKTNLKV